MLYPKIVVLTNKWVWNNPFYGFVVRYADYYPIFRGFNPQLVENLQSVVKKGYSILVFPEGTRTNDGRIKRFHQGAFWIAANLNIPIQPLMIHGANHCMTKGEFFLRPGTITLRSMEKFSVEKVKENESYRLQAKQLRGVYRKEFEKMSRELEVPAYYHHRLLRKFIYKGPVLEWYSKIKIALENKYTGFNDIIPEKADIVDIGCGYGYLSLMLHLVSDKRKITGIDYDENKIAVARNIAGENEIIQFEVADILSCDLPEADVFILLDVLHYLPTKYHESVIFKCIDNLNDNGFIIIRDADADRTGEIWRTKLNEFNSTRFFRFNKTKYPSLSYTSGSAIEKIARKKKFSVEKIDHLSKSSDVTFIIKPIVNHA